MGIWSSSKMKGGNALLQVNGYAKINLTLDILGTRGDGYHEVAMVMQSIGLHDTIAMEKTDGAVRLAVDVPGLAADESNLAVRAARLICSRYALAGGVSVALTKRIPIAAGLAGGSADAAAVLRGMNELYALHLPDTELCALGAQLGSDIPFVLMGGTMLATGRGEVLRRLPDMPHTHVVLAKPPVSVSTPWAYKTYDAEGADEHPDNVRIERAIAEGDRKAVASLLCNVLERVTIKKYPVVALYKEMMREQGALASMMSGSGPTVFALAQSARDAERIAAYLRRETDAAVLVTETRNTGCTAVGEIHHRS